MSGSPLLPVTCEQRADDVPCWSVRTPAKVNLFLEIEGRRDDGYHDLTTLMAAVALHDTITFRVRDTGNSDTLQVTGEAVPDGPENLVRRALTLLREASAVPPLAITLTKNIPPGSGLGGGSGNAAGMLAAANTAFELGLERAQLMTLGARLGTDVPFFLGSPVAVGTGRGDRLRPLAGQAFGGDRPRLLLILPPVSVATAAVYGGITLPLTSPSGPISFPERTFVNSGRWVRGLYNRLEGVTFDISRALRVLADWLEERTPGRWRMTGSGSGFYIVLEARDSAQELGEQIIEDLGTLDWAAADRRSPESGSREGTLGNQVPDNATRRDRPTASPGPDRVPEEHRNSDSGAPAESTAGLPSEHRGRTGSRTPPAALRILEVDILTEPLPTP